MVRLKSLLQFVFFIFCTISCNNDDKKIEIIANDIELKALENLPKNQIIGKVSATTNRGELNYRIVSQSPGQSIKIDQISGEILVNDPIYFDFEIYPVLEASVEISNGKVRELINVRIFIDDIDEGIYVGNVYLRNQNELDLFTENNYHTIDGNLTIDDDPNTDGTGNMSKLSSLKTVTGHVTIMNNKNILDLNGFEGLQIIGGLTITNTPVMDILALRNLEICSGPIAITNNPGLESYCGFNLFLKKGNFTNTFTVYDNLLNLTIEEIIELDCSDYGIYN